MASWMIIDELYGAKKRDFTDSSGMKQTTLFTCRQQFGLCFKYIHQVYDKKTQKKMSIYLESTRKTKFWPDHNFAWYLAVSEVNTALAPGHFQNDGGVQLSLEFIKAFAIVCLEINFWLNLDTMYNQKELEKYQNTSLASKS